MQSILNKLLLSNYGFKESEELKKAIKNFHAELEEMKLDENLELDSLIGKTSLAYYDEGFKAGFTSAFKLLVEIVAFGGEHILID